MDNACAYLTVYGLTFVSNSFTYIRRHETPIRDDDLVFEGQCISWLPARATMHKSVERAAV